MRRSLVHFLILAAFASSTSATKCGFLRYQVDGTILLPTGVTSESIHIVLLLDGSPYASAYPPQEGEQDFSVPRGDGTFSVVSHYDTTGERGCGRVATRGDLLVLGEGIRTCRQRLHFEKRGTKKNGASKMLGPIDPERCAVAELRAR